jgi:hypothetical protein
VAGISSGRRELVEGPILGPERCIEEGEERVFGRDPDKNVGDGRIRFWGRVSQTGEARPRVLRVVTLEVGETIHNAFFDRNFREDPS